MIPLCSRLVLRGDRISVALLLLMALPPLAAQQPLSLPPPRGHVNDFAGVIPPAQAAQIEALARLVRERSGGEIAVVTLRDIGGRDVADVALQIGREWRVGAQAEIGDARRNAGVVVLVVPKETSADGRGYIGIQTGQGVEGFIPDGVAGQIRREGAEYFRRQDYGGGLAVITRRIAERFAAEYGFELTGAPAAPRPPVERPGIPLQVFALVFLLFVVAHAAGRRAGCAPVPAGYRRRRGATWVHYGGFGGHWGEPSGSSRWSDFLSGGSGGSDFGGFGGGGGFSGGGSSGSW